MPMPTPGAVARRLVREPLLSASGALVLVLALLDPRPPGDWLSWAEPSTLAGLLALLASAQGIRESGWVQVLAQRLLQRMHGLRSLTLALLGLAAGLSMLLTNDVSLFLVVPLTLALAEHAELPRARLVALEALAVNAGSLLSPVGNPQNLLLWARSGLSMPAFALAMAPAFAVTAALLLATACLVVPRQPLRLRADPPDHVPDARLGGTAVVVLVAVLLLLDRGYAGLAALLAVSAFALVRVRVLRGMDWALLATIALMLLGLGHLAALPAVHGWLAGWPLQRPLSLYLAGVGLSQAISNVPATVALLQVDVHPLRLAVAANVGGFGLAIGSLANLIALRLEGSREGWREFHRLSLPFLLVAGVLCYLLAMP